MAPTWLQVLLKLAPTILAVIPGVPPALVPAIADGIAEAEAIGGSGPDKKAHVIKLATDAVTGINAAKGSTVLDPTSTIQAVSAGIDTTIAVINTVKAAHPAPPTAPPA
jgi:hypothetical protein